jgi:hypothetical protein
MLRSMRRACSCLMAAVSSLRLSGMLSPGRVQVIHSVRTHIHRIISTGTQYMCLLGGLAPLLTDKSSPVVNFFTCHLSRSKILRLAYSITSS